MKKTSAKQLLKKLNPLPSIGGLAIHDTILRFSRIEEGGKVTTASLRLPPGIIVNGKVQDQKNLVAALTKLHTQISSKRKPIHVVVSLPSTVVYTESFKVPYLDKKGLQEAAKLNLQMISPIEFSTAYAGYEKIGEGFKEGAQVDLLGAFAEAQIVNVFSDALLKAHFLVSAVEFPALSLTRFIKEEAGIDPKQSYLFIDVSVDGISLMILKNLNLYFNHFHSWKAIRDEVGGHAISTEDLNNFLLKEVQKVMNFYSGRWGGSVDGALVNAGNITNEVIGLLEKNFKVTVTHLATKKFKKINPAWFSVLGSAIRGTIPRSKDDFISLTKAPVQKQYQESRILSFIGLWRKIMITTLVFIFFLFLLADGFFIKQEQQSEGLFGSRNTSIELTEVIELQEEAKEFNALVIKAAEAKNNSVAWSPLFRKILILPGESVSLREIKIGQGPISLSGFGNSSGAVVSFKESLERQFENVVLPLANIKPGPDGSVSFSLTFDNKL